MKFLPKISEALKAYASGGYMAALVLIVGFFGVPEDLATTIITSLIAVLGAFGVVFMPANKPSSDL